MSKDHKRAKTEHVVMFSGGIGSWAAAKRVANLYGTSSLVLLFADTLIEDEDLYRFLPEAVENIGAPLVRIAEGRTPWEVYRDEGFLGNARIDPCSKMLKRIPCNRWLDQNRDPSRTIVHVGIDWTEFHRFDRLALRRRQDGWVYSAPLCEQPYLSKADLFGLLQKEGIRPPRLYKLGFSHNNCGGFCCKAGQAHFARLLATMPDRYAQHEASEQDLRAYLGKNVSILTDRKGKGPRRPLTLSEFRMRMQQNSTFEEHEIGGCGCFADEEGL